MASDFLFEMLQAVRLAGAVPGIVLAKRTACGCFLERSMRSEFHQEPRTEPRCVSTGAVSELSVNSAIPITMLAAELLGFVRASFE